MTPNAAGPAASRTESTLSRRESEVLALLARGATYAAIARDLRLSPHTVDTYLRRIRAKTGATGQVQLTLLAYRLHGFPAAA
ncbi:helix-turn-helix transcriptional regulator [Kitasatospora sp. NPDC002227]|uniref:response regulator transcription factor n=1 Tax=Kitasatospora sp. NPDC002227 TaxID=3154773 RepID=UPI003320D085